MTSLLESSASGSSREAVSEVALMSSPSPSAAGSPEGESVGGSPRPGAAREGSALHLHLRHTGKNHNKRKGKNSGRGLIPNRVDIDP
jgi:hypothetical protein